MHVQIPYKEDIKKYAFSSIDSVLFSDKPDPSRKKLKMDSRAVEPERAKEAINALVDAMNIEAIVDTSEGYTSCFLMDSFKDAYEPKDVFHPLYQRQGDWIAHRVLHPDDDHFPEINPKVLQGITPMPEIMSRARSAMEDVKSSFVLKKGTNFDLSLHFNLDSCKKGSQTSHSFVKAVIKTLNVVFSKFYHGWVLLNQMGIFLSPVFLDACCIISQS